MLEADFFISYKADTADLVYDSAWAKWVAHQLTAAGYEVIFQEGNFLPGSNFVLEIDRALKAAKRVLLLLSPAYLDLSEFGSAEWAAAFADDPAAKQRRMIPIRVRPCQPKGLLRSVVYIDLAELPETQAQHRLLERLSIARPIVDSPPFPGQPGSAFPSPEGEEGSAVFELATKLFGAGIVRFQLDRSQYVETLSGFLERARSSITIVSVYLAAKGAENAIREVLEAKLSTSPLFAVSATLLKPHSPAMSAAATALGVEADWLSEQSSSMLNELVSLRDSLHPHARHRLRVLTHNVLPIASTIMLDEDSSDGTIQLETKLYRAPQSDSFGFEIEAGSSFYQRNLKAARMLIEDSIPYQLEQASSDE